MDGDVDYSKYSAVQLAEALTHIDAERYPLNFANLQRELQVRPMEPQEPTPYEVPFRGFAVWPVAWVAAVFGPVALATSAMNTSLVSVGTVGYIAWSSYIGFGYRRRGDTVGFTLAAAVPLALLAVSSGLSLLLKLGRH